MAENIRVSKDLRLCIDYARSLHDDEWNSFYKDSDVVAMFARSFLFDRVGLNNALAYLEGKIDLRS